MSELTFAEFVARIHPRFAKKVRLDEESGCWLWIGGHNSNGYGMFMRPDQRRNVAHKFAYESMIGPVPDGLDLDHLCRVRDCVNVAHLEPVTRRTNLRRGQTLNAACAAKTHCPYGHPYSGVNLYVTTEGFRKCRTCRRAARAAQRARLRALAAPFCDHPDFQEQWR